MNAEFANTEKRRIAFLLSSFRAGGAERVMIHLANAFASHGIQVDVLTINNEGPLRCELDEECRIVDLQPHPVLTRLVKYSQASLPGLVRYLRKERPQVLISALEGPNRVAVWAKHLAHVQCKVIATVHNTLSKQHRTDWVGRITAWLTYPVYRRHADAVVAVSHGAADDMAKLTGTPRERINVIYNPVISDELYIKAQQKLDHPWFTENAPPVILGAGRLHPQKDFSTLIRAFALVCAQRPARLMILGEGPEREMLEKLIDKLNLRDSVALPGFIQNPYPYMKAARLFVLSSHYEGLPTVLIEALSLGTPAVSTDCPSGPREILEDGKWGRLTPVGDVNALAQIMLDALDNPGIDPSPRGADFTIERALQQYERLART